MPRRLWAIDFQFDSTVDGKAIKIASMIDEHTRESLLHVVERSITAERLVAELDSVFAVAGGPPRVLRMDNGPELVSQALQGFCDGKIGLYYIPPGTPWNNGYIESFNNRLRRSASTATTGTPCSRPEWSSVTSSASTIADIATQLWATERRSSTLRRAGTPIPRCPAKSTDPGELPADAN
jgi:putative transposase